MGKQPRRGEEAPTWTQGLDASLPPKGWDTITGHAGLGLSPAVVKEVSQFLRKDWRWDCHVDFCCI